MFPTFQPATKNHTFILTLKIRNATIVRVTYLRDTNYSVFPNIIAPVNCNPNSTMLTSYWGEQAARTRERRGQIQQWGRENMGLRLAVDYLPFISLASTHVAPYYATRTEPNPESGRQKK